MSNLSLKANAKTLSSAVSGLKSTDQTADYAKMRLETTCVEAVTGVLRTRTLPDKLHAVVEENYQEEIGKDERPHNESRADAVLVLRPTYQPYLPKAIEERLSANSSFLLGMFLFTEYQVPSEYQALLDRINHFFSHIDPIALQHFVDHIKHDVHHFRELKLALDDYAGLDQAELFSGAQFMYEQRMKLLQVR